VTGSPATERPTATAGGESVALHACRVAHLVVRREAGGSLCGRRDTGHTAPRARQGHRPTKSPAFPASVPQRTSAPCAAYHPSFPGRSPTIHGPAITRERSVSPVGAERAAAELAVARLTGVRNARDEIEISYDADPVDVDLHVQEALDRSALVPDDSDDKAATEGSTITLTGHVRTWAEHDAVVGAAWMACGVIDVDD
jgi:hypothetical protein